MLGFESVGFGGEPLCAENRHRRIGAREFASLAGDVRAKARMHIERDARVRAPIAAGEQV